MRNCEKGYNCGDTCIEKADKCLADLRLESGNVASSMALVINSVTDVGRDSSAAGKSNANKLEPEDAQAYLDIETGKRKPYSNPEWAKWAENKKNIDDVWEGLSGDVKQVFKVAGFSTGKQATEGAYAGGANDERGKAVLAKFISGAGKDTSGKALEKWNKQIQLDHIKPISTKGQDRPDNWQVVSRQYNQLKQSKPPEELIKLLEAQAKTSKEDFAKNSAKATAKKQEELDFTAKMSDRKNRGALTEADISKFSETEAKSLLKGIGATYRANRLGKQDLATGVITGKGGSGSVSVGEIKQLAREALLLERAREQGLTKYDGKYLPSTIKAINDRMVASNPKNKNPVELVPEMRAVLGRTDAPDLSAFKLIPELIYKES